MTAAMVAIQLAGLAGLLLGAGSFQSKKRRRILGIQLASNCSWIIHYLLLGASTGAGLNVVGGLRAYAFSRYDQKHRPGWLLGAVIAAIFLATALTWQGWVSLLPAAGMTTATIGFWQRNTQHIRLIALCASPLWLVYGLLSGSYAAVAAEVLMVASLLISLWRHRRTSRAERLRA